MSGSNPRNLLGTNESEFKQLHASVASNMLKELVVEGKITEEMADIYKQKLNRLNEAIIQSMQNVKLLDKKFKNLRSNMITENVTIRTTKEMSNRNQNMVKILNEIFTTAADEVREEEEKYRTLDEELKRAKNEIKIRKEKLENDRERFEKNSKAKLQKIQTEIDKLEDEKNLENEKIKNELDKIKQFEEMKSKKIENNRIKEKELKKLEDDVSNVRDEPIRYEGNLKKKNDELEDKKKDLAKEEAKIKNRNKEYDDLDDTYKKYSKVKEKKEKENKAEEKEKIRLKSRKETFEREVEKLEANINDLVRKKKENQEYIDEQVKKIKEKIERINKTKKTTDRMKRNYKKLENTKNNIKNLNYENKMRKDKIIKERQDIRNQITKVKGMNQNVYEEQMMMTVKKSKLKNQETENKSSLIKLKEKIKDYENKLVNLQNLESDAVKTVKNLTTIRETMARKASAALAEVRETREELKIKELLILDLTKKQQEIEFKLNSYKAYYEEVKGARNKYVNLIQNASQNLAELKERIKISQNELEILKNESSEKERTLNKLNQTIQAIIHERDKARAELNKLEYKKKNLVERGNQQANEIAKLNMITLSLQNDMLEIRKHYESACESRNYMGVQLIDRNDELCILYEKNNIQENIIRNGETEIKKLEDDIRMIKIEIKEVENQIKVARKKIPLIPKLTDKIVQLKDELTEQKKIEQKYSEKLEDPTNTKRLRELKAEDPDQEALEAKIQVLEERLNMKKEALLEKELILDEVTNLSENMRKQALEGRYSTLEISSKVNELQARLKRITRKMMATISELSMFQANVIKLDQEKEHAYKQLESVRERVDTELPPTEDAEIEFLKVLRDKKRYQEQVQARMQQEIIKKNMSPFAVRTTAEPRPNAYIDEIGLPRPYGKFRPFKPSDLGANMRHYRRPKEREIEI